VGIFPETLFPGYLFFFLYLLQLIVNVKDASSAIVHALQAL
jgi:hypothetical protein